MHHSSLKQQEALLQYIWHVALTAPRSTSHAYVMIGFDVFVVGTLLLLNVLRCFVCFQASIFVQSHVRAHVELMWLLSSSTPIGWLNRMIQFKEKSRKAVRHSLYDSFTIVFCFSWTPHQLPCITKGIIKCNSQIYMFPMLSRFDMR